MGRKASITSAARIEREQRTATILQMRVSGLTLRDIGQAQAPPVSGVAIFKAIKRALEQMPREPFEQARRVEEMRLDEMLVPVYAKALAGDLASIDAVLSIQARRARLLGLDIVAPRPDPAAAIPDRDNPPQVKVEIVGAAAMARRERAALRMIAAQSDEPEQLRLPSDMN
jgi:hypothetical protein